MRTDRRTESSLPPEMRCEQIEDREREHWTEAMAYGIEPVEQPKRKVNDNGSSGSPSTDRGISGE